VDALAAARPVLDAAGRAGAELRAALDTRRGLPLPTTDLPTHPMLRPKPAPKQHGPRR